jgi:hypothetical protein
MHWVRFGRFGIRVGEELTRWFCHARPISEETRTENDTYTAVCLVQGLFSLQTLATGPIRNKTVPAADQMSTCGYVR